MAVAMLAPRVRPIDEPERILVQRCEEVIVVTDEEVTVVEKLEQLKTELRELLGSWEYAFAMGHGCTIGEDPQFWITRRRAAVLTARIQELEGDL